MSTDNQNNPTDMNPRRRGSVTQQALAGLFRSNSTSMGVNFQTSDPNRRRLSIATTGIGLAGTSPTTTSGAAFSSFRRGSISTNSDSIDENAIDEEESSRTAPVTPFTRRMSFGAPSMRPRNGNGSPGSNGNNPSAPSRASAPKPPAVLGRRGSVNPRSLPADQGFNWSEQLRSRAESSVTGQRPSFSFGASNMSTSPPRASLPVNSPHDRAKSVSDMPAPPAQAMKPKAPEPQRQKPDAFQERILKGDFYMD
ncbi:hypothetical protein F5X68DRAFT_66109 [Plectosphaerella plurivora]|uniref:Uncharacterized protein n=1 Tax=Plectosphaerella plurivora TaxID=936078 RepID=A0A9P9AFE2_9PEZI|nr:hypothetical protein F5X68DRAFT_66109 [Plectosphaerella plurivora]